MSSDSITTDSIQAIVDTVSAAMATASGPMTIKDMLAKYESEIVIVFAVLVYAVILFKVFSLIIGAIKQHNQPKSNTVSEPTVHVDSGANAGSTKLIDVDEKTAAQIMAIVAHESEIPVDQLIFKSIKAL